MSQRRCLFCGEPFTGQGHNFEHVIPKWLVREADLSKRTAPVDFPTRKFSAAMSRLGGRACETCNAASSDLEGRAGIAYAKVRDGEDLSLSDGRALLDWLDKLRVGMWLWTVEVGKEDYGVNPKFRINERMANKDRILLATKYPPGPTMKGLEFWGANEYFVITPSALGFFINNVVLVSLSSNFLLARHLAKLSIKRFLHDTGDEEVDVDRADVPGQRLEFFGAPFILGQVILPTAFFKELGLEMDRVSPFHPECGEGPILRLNGKLEESGREPGSVAAFNGNPQAHLILMEFYLDTVAKYLLDDTLASDFSRMTSPEKQAAAQAEARQFLAQTKVDLHRLAVRYERLTGIKLIA